MSVTISAAHAQGRNHNPGVLPPHSTPYGLSYGAWGAVWWKWAGEETGFLPVADETGEFCHLGQSGPVWMLAGNFGGVSERECTVPTGKALFVPLLNAAANASPFFDPFFPDGITDEELRDIVNQIMEVDGTLLTCTVNGVELENLEAYRADSPVFQFFGFNAVADGYWIMLAPLPPGEHTIHFTGFRPAFNLDLNGVLVPMDEFSLDVTYHLTVQP